MFCVSLGSVRWSEGQRNVETGVLTIACPQIGSRKSTVLYSDCCSMKGRIMTFQVWWYGSV